MIWAKITHPNGTHSFDLARCELIHACIWRIVHVTVNCVQCRLASGLVGTGVRWWTRAIILRPCFFSSITDVIIWLRATIIEGMEEACMHNRYYESFVLEGDPSAPHMLAIQLFQEYGTIG